MQTFMFAGARFGGADEEFARDILEIHEKGEL